MSITRSPDWVCASGGTDQLAARTKKFVNELDHLAEDRNQLLSRVRKKVKKIDTKKLSRAVNIQDSRSRHSLTIDCSTKSVLDRTRKPNNALAGASSSRSRL